MIGSKIYEQPYDAPWNSLQVPYIIGGSPKSLTPSPTLSTSPLYEGPIDTPEIYRTIYGDKDKYSYINPGNVLEHESDTTTPAYCCTTTDEIVQKEKLEFQENFKHDTYDVVGSSIRDDTYDVITSSIKSGSFQPEPTYISTDAIVERKRISRAEHSKNVAKESEKINKLEKCQSNINEYFVDSTEQPNYMILEKEQLGVEENFYDIAAS